MTKPTRTVGRSVVQRAAQLGSKIGGITQLGSRAVADAHQPSADLGKGQNRTQAFTWFTKVPVPGESTPILYNGDRLWTRLVLTLETAGPVAVGTSSSLAPVLSGKGQTLETGVPTQFTIAKGTRLYVASSSVNRIKVTVEPVPWLEQITATLGLILGRLAGKGG